MASRPPGFRMRKAPRYTDSLSGHRFDDAIGNDDIGKVIRQIRLREIADHELYQILQSCLCNRLRRALNSTVVLGRAAEEVVATGGGCIFLILS
jgi:hypothetical protein